MSFFGACIGVVKSAHCVRNAPGSQECQTFTGNRSYSRAVSPTDEPDALWQIGSFALNTSTFLLRIRRQNNPDVTVLERNCGQHCCRLQQYSQLRAGRIMIAEDSEAAWLQPAKPDR